MARAIGRMTHLSTSPDRALYRRQKKVSLREARLTENLEKQQRVDRERREKQKHDDYLQGILQHGREVLTLGTSSCSTMATIGQSCGAIPFSCGKGGTDGGLKGLPNYVLRRLKMTMKRRILKLVDQAKDTRITHLLKQTSRIWMVWRLRCKTTNGVRLSYGQSEDEDDDDDGEGKVDYYAVAHGFVRRLKNNRVCLWVAN